MPLTPYLRDLSAMPRRSTRSVAADHDIMVGLKAGLVLEVTASVEFPECGMTARSEVLRKRAGRAGLKQISRRTRDEHGRVVLRVQWYREHVGDLRERKQPRRRPAGSRG